MEESDSTLPYRIIGHKLNGLFAKRLANTGLTSVNYLPGKLVKTSRGLYYSEMYEVENKSPLDVRDLDETLDGLVISVTKEMAKKGKSSFNAVRFM